MSDPLPRTGGSLGPASGYTGNVWGRCAAFLVAVLFAVLAGRLGESFFEVSDAGFYVRLAHGDHGVMQPFASRQLGPLAVRAAAALLHIPVEHGFLAQGALSLLVLAGFVFLFAARPSTSIWLLAAMAILPFWPEIFHDLALPDLWYAALLAMFLMLLQKEQWLAAACMMLPLMLSRESTSLTLLCFLIAGWRELRPVGWVVSVAAAALGSLLTARLTAGSPGNAEHLPGFVYLLLKLPWNLLRLLGIRPWSNEDRLLCAVPRWQVPLHVGQVTAVGVCGFNRLSPLLALSSMTTLFGLLPVIVFFLWRRSQEREPRSVLLRFVLLYGGIAFVLAPAIGVSYSRLFGYAWPLVLVALPLLAAKPGARLLFPSGRAHWPLLSLHVIACAAWFAPLWWSAWVGVGAWIVAGMLLSREAGADADGDARREPSGAPHPVM